MNKHSMIKLFFILSCFAIVGASVARAQGDKYLELMRSDVKTQKVELITHALALSDSEGAIFWPIYRQYDVDLSKIGDRRIALIKKYADNYMSMDNKMAKQISEEWFKIQKGRLDLLKKYFTQIEKKLSVARAAQFVQAENYVGLLIDVQVSDAMPFIQKMKESPGGVK